MLSANKVIGHLSDKIRVDVIGVTPVYPSAIDKLSDIYRTAGIFTTSVGENSIDILSTSYRTKSEVLL